MGRLYYDGLGGATGAARAVLLGEAVFTRYHSSLFTRYQIQSTSFTDLFSPPPPLQPFAGAGGAGCDEDALAIDPSIAGAGQALVRGSTQKYWGRALPLWLVFLRAKGFSGGDPFFLSQERSIDGVLVRTLASFAEYVKDLQERGSSKTAMLDLRNAFLRRGLAVLAFKHELVLKARANRGKSGRKVSEEKDERAKAAVTPELFMEFLRLFWDLHVGIIPRTRESLTAMMTATCGALALVHALRISELVLGSKPRGEAAGEEDEDKDVTEELQAALQEATEGDVEVLAEGLGLEGFPDVTEDAIEEGHHLIARDLMFRVDGVGWVRSCDMGGYTTDRVSAAAVAHRTSKTNSGQRSRIETVWRRSDLESRVLDMLITFAQESGSGPTDPFLSRRAFGNYPRKKMTAHMLRDAIKGAAVSLHLDSNRFSPKSFKMAGITWLIQAGVSQTEVNSAADHAQGGSSSFHYQDTRVHTNPLVVAATTAFDAEAQSIGSVFRK